MHSALRKSGKVTAVSIAALLTGNPAFAVESSQLLNGSSPGSLQQADINALNIGQTANTSQTVLNLAVGGRANNIDQAGINVLNMVDLPGVSPGSIVQLADARQQTSNEVTAGDIVNGNQIAQNTANVVRAENLIEQTVIEQTVSASQRSTNKLSAGRVLNATQEASNIANFVRAAEVDTVDQVFKPGSEQIARNIAEADDDATGLVQSATNLLNVVRVSGVARVIAQSFPSGTRQVASNELETSGDAQNINQNALNIANFIQGTDVGMIEREAAGDQLARNTIKTGGDFENISQAALNVVNYAQVDNVDILDQAATGTQTTVNRITIAGKSAGNAQQIQQVFLNSANMVEAPGSIGKIKQTTDVDTKIINEINGTNNNAATSLTTFQSASSVGNLVIIDNSK